MTSLDIAVLLPDVLGTYSDTGNALVLAERARRRGVPARVQHVNVTDTPPTSCDVYLLGGGEDTAQITAAVWLRRHRALCDAIASRRVTLAVCAGFQLLGTAMTDRTGHRHAGAGVLDVSTEPGHRRATGQVIAGCTIPGIGLLTGFENHLGRTTLGPGLAPLGHVEHGIGNGTPTSGRGDGIATTTVLGTYLHGPILARNPALADHIISRATGLTLAPLDLPDQDEVRRTYLTNHLDTGAAVMTALRRRRSRSDRERGRTDRRRLTLRRRQQRPESSD